MGRGLSVMRDNVESVGSEERFDIAVFPCWRQSGFAEAEDIQAEGFDGVGPVVHEVGRGTSFPVGLEAGGPGGSRVFGAHVVPDAGVAELLD